MKAFDPVNDPGPAPSPCVNVCRMNADRAWCEGCLRSIDEIRQWSTASEETKRSIWKTLLEREQNLFN